MSLKELINVREVISAFEKRLKKFRDLKQTNLVRIYEFRIEYLRKKEKEIVEKLSSKELDGL